MEHAASEVSKPQVTRVAAYGLVVEDGRILLCRISEQLPRNKGEWTLPGGGIEFGEHPRDAVVREVFEETGLPVAVDELVTVDSITVDLDESVAHGIRIVYRVSVQGGELTNEIDGSTDLCGWFTPQEAQQLPLVGLARLGLELAFGS